jgi:DNA-binding NarL/FixJ family response regulator
MGDKRRILIVEDHTLLRAGLRALLLQDPEVEVVGESDNGRDALRSIGQLNPHLILMDLSMPGMNGIEAITDIKRRYPDTRVLVLTCHKTEEYVHESLRAGADGYLLKEATHAELHAAVHCVLSGKTYLSPDIASKVISGYLGAGKTNRKSRDKSTSPGDTLTRRERQILKLAAEGNTNKLIADFLFLSVKTVEKHRSNLMKKLGLHNASALTAYAMENGVISGASVSRNSSS